MDTSADILIIEDNSDVRENLEEILELFGYEVRSAPNGLEGVKAAKAKVPDLILCDVMMPELDGFGVLDILSEDPATAWVPFVFITARTEKEDIRRGMNLGADDYITKPFYKDELLSVIKTRLKKSQMRGMQSQSPVKTLLDPEGGLKKLLKTIQESGRLQTFEPKERIIHAGELPRSLFLIESGRVHLRRSHEYGKEYILSEIGPGDILGLASLVDESPYHFDAVVTNEGCTCWTWSGTAALALINQNSDVSAAVSRLLAGRLLAEEEHLVRQAYDSVRRRTALILCDLYEKHEHTEIVLPREELAQMVGTTKESVIRALSDFKRENMITIRGSKIEVVKPTELRNLSV